MSTSISDNALEILKTRYFIEGETRPEDMFRRVAMWASSAEQDKDQWEDLFYEVMCNLDFLPNSPTLMNAGTELTNPSACFVLPIEDSMDSIFQAVKDAAIISKSGGGVGFSFSRLRPKGSPVGTTKGVASGPVSFMEPFNSMVECVKQGSKRRGALMGVLRVDHPDIEEFICCKDNPTRLNNFNISVAITDEFMKAVEEDRMFPLCFRDKVYKTVRARDLWDRIAEHAWRTGEPGIIFIDRVNEHNPVPQFGMVESTNPCGEQPLLPYEACTLGSINLVNMYDKHNKLDLKKLKLTVSVAIKFLDNCITLANYPLEEINNNVRRTRKIGLGVMGFADLLYKLGIPYGSEASIKLALELMSIINEYARNESMLLAEMYGRHEGASKHVRNATRTTIAPTGTISIIANVSSGIEPNFLLAYKRKAHSMNKEFIFVNRVLEEELKIRGLYSEELINKIIENGGTLKGLSEIPSDMQNVFITAADIKPEQHVHIQAAFQKHTDNSISKTVNLPSSATVEDVKKVYNLAFTTGCKGVTIYRDGSRSDQVLSAVSTEQASRHENIHPKPRPEIVSGDTQHIKVGCGKIYCTVNIDQSEELVETFVNTGADGVCPGFSQGISRMVSLAARCGIAPEDIVDQLTSVSCRNCKGLEVKSCPDAIGRAIARKLNLKTRGGRPKTANHPCPECGAEMNLSEGCLTCLNCGYSKCS